MRAVSIGLVALVSLAALVTATPPSWAATAPRAAGAAAPRTDRSGTVWLCRPGQSQDPCDGDLSSTVVTGNGRRSVEAGAVGRHHRFNCFYVYPTASNESTVNADLTVQPAETAVATDQAARFSSVCDVWAPMYRQITVNGLSVANTTDPGAYGVAYRSVLAAWRDFITHDDDGRPVIFIGHSQGSVMLIKLLEGQIDPDPRLRALMVAAIIVGGNVTVPIGRTVGATFQNLPLCTAEDESGCVIAYSSFPSEPPADANFGRPGQGISLNTGQTQTTGVQVACVNPAAIGGGTAYLATYWPVTTPLPIPSMAPPAPAVTTPWLDYPRQYTGTCEDEGGASWLQVTPVRPGSDTRPLVSEIAGPAWGYHFQDINLALGDLVRDVRGAESAYDARP